MKIFQKRISYKVAGALIFIMLFFTLGTTYLILSARGNNDSKESNTSTQNATESASAQESTVSSQPATDKSSNISKDSKDGSSNSDPAQEVVEESPPITLPLGNTVTITSTGFSPSTITIGVGESVTWVNNDSKNSWPASDRHPIHDEYPGFDSFGIIVGSNWSFQFNNTGTWDYHDHNKPSRIGTVVVQ